MKVCVLYRPNAEYSRQVEEFAHDFEKRMGKHLDLVDIDSKDGIAFASLYDVNDHPAIVATANDGQILRSWEGPILPLMDEVAFYLQDQDR